MSAELYTVPTALLAMMTANGGGTAQTVPLYGGERDSMVLRLQWFDDLLELAFEGRGRRIWTVQFRPAKAVPR